MDELQALLADKYKTHADIFFNAIGVDSLL